jgi:hypothetical protein
MLTFMLGAAGDESMKSARIGAFAVVLRGRGRRWPDGDYAERRAERGENVFQGGR